MGGLYRSYIYTHIHIYRYSPEYRSPQTHPDSKPGHLLTYPHRGGELPANYEKVADWDNIWGNIGIRLG